MAFAVPAVKLTHQENLASAGRPHSKMNAWLAVNLGEMGAHFFIGSLVAALADKITIKIG
jgi:hypothetical protein